MFIITAELSGPNMFDRFFKVVVGRFRPPKLKFSYSATKTKDLNIMSFGKRFRAWRGRCVPTMCIGHGNMNDSKNPSHIFLLGPAGQIAYRILPILSRCSDISSRINKCKTSKPN